LTPGSNPISLLYDLALKKNIENKNIEVMSMGSG
jgi:hypothetical protein